MMKTDEDRNVIGVLRGRLEFSESDGNVLEVLGVLRGFGQYSVGVSEDGWMGVGGAVGDRYWIGWDLSNQTGILTT